MGLTFIDAYVIYIIWLFLAVVIRDIFRFNKEHYYACWALIIWIALCFLLPVSTFTPEESILLSTTIGKYLAHLVIGLIGGVFSALPLLYIQIL